MYRRFCTISEGAARIRKSYGQTLRLLLIGDLKGERRNGRWLIDASDLERFAREQKRQMAAAAR